MTQEQEVPQKIDLVQTNLKSNLNASKNHDKFDSPIAKIESLNSRKSHDSKALKYDHDFSERRTIFYMKENYKL